MSQEVFQVITPKAVKLLVTDSVSSKFSETRFQKGITILDLKHRLEMMTGIVPSTMKLQLFDKVDKQVSTLDDDTALLGSYPVEDDMRLHVSGQSCLAMDVQDASELDRKVLSEAEYDNMNNTLRAFLVRNKLGKYSDDVQEKAEKASSEVVQAVGDIAVGDRCQVSIPGQPPKRGQVKYVGDAHFKPGVWVGVQYDEPVGKNDGSVDGKSYFKCNPKYGAFVRPQHVKVGDYPEEDYGLNEDEM